MFKHSVKVSRLYKVAANIAKDVSEGKGSVKQLVYENKKKHPRIKSLYALVTTLFQKSDEIESLLRRSQFFTKETRLDPWLTKVLIVELLWGKKRLAGESKPEKTVQAYEQIFKAHLNDVCLPTDADKHSKVESKPRYVRVNTLNATLSEAVDGFRDEGWDLCKFLDKTNYKEFLSKVVSLAENEFLVDIHVPNLLVFPPRTEFYNHPAYKNGSIVFQDKASCLPVHILGPEPGSIVLDMCAAPGMKTTQAAAVMNNEGTIYAVEMNPQRFGTLNKIVDSSGATCVKTINKDVLRCSGADFPGVQYILVDPSCTGSGMTDRLKFEQEASQDRVQRLAGFQIKILRSALTRYPDAKRVVYSTCSIFPEENEDVVRQVLETNFTFKLVPAKQYVNNTWTNFGSPDFGDIGKYCLYAKPDEDLTNGFFVAVFERLEEGEKNDFFNTKIYNYKKHIQSQEKRRSKKQQEFDGESGKDIQQQGDDMVGIVYEDAMGNNVHGNVKRKKNKNAKNDFIGNDETWTERNSNVEVEKKMESIKETIEITGNKSNSVRDLEAVSSKKRKKGGVVDIDQHFPVKSEDIVEKNDKRKKRRESHSKIFENHDEENFESVKHKKKKKKESHTERIGIVTKSNEIGHDENTWIERNSNVEDKEEKYSIHEVTATRDLETAIKKRRKGEIVEEHFVNKTEYIIEEKHKKKKRKESHSETFESRLGENIEPVTHKKKKKKKLHIECTGTPTESSEKVNLGTFSNEFSVTETQTKKAKRNAKPVESNLELIERDYIKKKKRDHGNKKIESTVENNGEVIVVNHSNESLAMNMSKKKKKNKESLIEHAGTVFEGNNTINKKEKKTHRENKVFAIETQTRENMRSSESRDNDLELTKESNSTIIKKKKKKHRENKELETTDQNNDDVSVVNDNDFFSTEIHISKKKKKRKEPQGEEAVNGNSDPVNITKKKSKSNVNENVDKKGSIASLANVETLVMRKKKKKILNC